MEAPSPGLRNLDQVGTSQVQTLLKLNGNTIQELSNIEKLDFNIFSVMESTFGEELVTVTSYLLATQNCFSFIDFDTFRHFMTAI